jgi:hypothetical protein
MTMFECPEIKMVPYHIEKHSALMVYGARWKQHWDMGRNEEGIFKQVLGLLQGQGP